MGAVSYAEGEGSCCAPYPNMSLNRLEISRDLLFLADADVDPHDLGIGCVARGGDCGVAVAEFVDEPLGVFAGGGVDLRRGRWAWVGCLRRGTRCRSRRPWRGR